MRSMEVEVRDKSGLHIRPAAEFVQVAARFASGISVQNLTIERPQGDAKSLLVPHAATSGSEWWTSALRRQALAGRALRLCQRRYARMAASCSV